jgi:hypothetical protein
MIFMALPEGTGEYYSKIEEMADATTPDKIGSSLRQTLEKSGILKEIKGPAVVAEYQIEIVKTIPQCIFIGWKRAGIIERTGYTEVGIVSNS